MISYEAIKPVIDRMFTKTATVPDLLQYLRFEMQEAMKCLPPEPDGKPDVWHAGACCLRAYASLFQLERVIQPTLSIGLRRCAECGTELAGMI